MADELRVAGLLIFVGATQFFILMNISAFLYPGYSISQNYISDLGVGPSAIIFNGSVVLLGLLGITASYLLLRVGVDRVFVLLLLLASVGAVGVGVFPENMGILHTISAFIAFLFGGIGALYSYRVELTIFRYIWLILGLVSLVALVFFASDNYMGLGVGGMERLIVYPVIIWLIGIASSMVNGAIRK